MGSGYSNDAIHLQRHERLLKATPNSFLWHFYRRDRTSGKDIDTLSPVRKYCKIGDRRKLANCHSCFSGHYFAH
jgi:hypothetical protein